MRKISKKSAIKWGIIALIVVVIAALAYHFLKPEEEKPNYYVFGNINDGCFGMGLSITVSSRIQMLFRTLSKERNHTAPRY